MLKIIKNIGIKKLIFISTILSIIVAYLTSTTLFYAIYGEAKIGEVLISLIIPSLTILTLLPKLIHNSFALYNEREKTKAIEGHDKVTGFYNKRYFLTHLRRELSSAKRYNYSLSVMKIPITNFAAIEKEKGRHISEHVIKEISERLEKGFRKSDILSRYNNDTFMVILPQTSKKSSQKVASRIQATLEDTPVFHLDKIEIFTTISIEEIERNDNENEDTLLNRLEPY